MIRPPPVRRNSRRGFTLLETLVALAIVGLAVAAVLQVLGASARSAERARTTTEALFVAEDLMEEMVSLDESELRARAGDSGELSERRTPLARLRPGVSHLSGPAPQTRYSYAVNVTPERDDPGVYRVDVEVGWREPRPGRLELTTLRRFAQEQAVQEQEL